MQSLPLKTVRQECHLTGYDHEEEYFHQLNWALISALREERSRKLAQFASVSYLALPEAKPHGFKNWVAKLFTPRPTGIGSFPV